MALTFKKLFEPGKIGDMEVKNRIVMAPMGTRYVDEDGYVTPRQINYYAERAKGGVGLTIVEISCVQSPIGKTSRMRVVVDDDKYLPGLSQLAEAIKRNGARVAIQLSHAGNAAPPEATGGLQPVAPSSVHRRGYRLARPLTIAEIEEIINCFIEAALRSQKAGFDAVEIHAAGHDLLAQFLSPAWNERTDEYGGGVQNRARVLIEIVKGIKEKAPDLPLICRFNGMEYGAKEFFGVERGLSLEDAQEVAKLLEANGADALHVTCFGLGQFATKHVSLSLGEELPLAEAIKRIVSIPIIAVGRLTPEVGEQALRQGKADFIAIARGLLADPYLPQKAVAGELTDITPCISCLNCLPRHAVQGPIRCSVNARCGREADYPYPLTKVKKPKKVVIIGGGPGGMEAARVAALRGHKVVLYEKESELGGQLLVADKPPFKQNIRLLTEYLKRQVVKVGVKVEIEKEATEELVLAHQPDAVIVATGALPLKPEIKGLEKAKVVTAIDVLARRVEVGEKVVVIGGEMVGCEIAEFLAERGKKVTIVRRGERLATKLASPYLRVSLLSRLTDKGVGFQTGATYKEAIKKGLVIIDKEGREQILEADTIVLASGSQPDKKLLPKLEGKVPQIYCIGDAKEPRQIVEAIHEGFSAAYSL